MRRGATHPSRRRPARLYPELWSVLVGGAITTAWNRPKLYRAQTLRVLGYIRVSTRHLNKDRDRVDLEAKHQDAVLDLYSAKGAGSLLTERLMYPSVQSLETSEADTRIRTSSQSVRVVSSGPGAFFVWSIREAEQLRSVHRIIGELVGCAANHVGQNQFLGLPLALDVVEVALGLTEGFITLEEAPWTRYRGCTPELRQAFESERETSRLEQLAAEAKLAEQRRLQFMAAEEWRIARERKRFGQTAARKRPHSGECIVHGHYQAADELCEGSATAQDVPLCEDAGQPSPPRKRPRFLQNVDPIRTAARLLSHVHMESLLGVFRRVWLASRACWQSTAYVLTSSVLSQRYRSESRDEETVPASAVQHARSSKPQGEATLQSAADSKRVRPYRIRIHTERAPFEVLNADTAETVLLDHTNVYGHEFWRSITRSPRFLVFRDLWRRGFYLTSGHKFGADFLAYAHDPCLFHAGLCVIVLNKNDILRPRDIISAGRLGVATKKRATLACVEDIEQGIVSYRGIAWCEALP